MNIPLKTAIEALECLKLGRQIANTHSAGNYDRLLNAQLALQACLEPILKTAIEVKAPSPADAEFEFHRQNLQKVTA